MWAPIQLSKSWQQYNQAKVGSNTTEQYWTPVQQKKVGIRTTEQR